MARAGRVALIVIPPPGGRSVARGYDEMLRRETPVPRSTPAGATQNGPPPPPGGANVPARRVPSDLGGARDVESRRGMEEFSDAAAYTRSLARGLLASGSAVRVLTSGDSGAAAVECEVAAFPRLGRPLVGALAFSRAAAHLRAFGPEILHAQAPEAWAVTRRLARALRAPFAVTVHEFVDRPGDLPWPPGLWPLCIVLSEALRENLVNAGGVPKVRLVVVPPGLELEERPAGQNAAARPGEAAAPAKTGTLIVGCIAPLVEAKGVEFFIRAARRVIDAGRDAEFVIRGVGPCEEELRRLAIELGVRERLTFLGEEVGPEQLLPSLDVFVLPGLREAVGTSALRAMACAKPVVAFGTGGVFALVRDGATGFLVEPRDDEAMARAIVRLHDEGALRVEMGRAGRALVEREFPLDGMVRATEEAYSLALAEAQPQRA